MTKTLLAETLLSVSVLLTFCCCSAVHSETLVWEFPIGEEFIKNGSEADGSSNSPGIGEGYIQLDLDTNVVSYDLSWSGLIGDLTKLHIHGPASTEISNPQHIIEIFGPPEIPADLVATSGSVSDSFQLETLLQVGFDPLSPEAIIDAMVNGQAYLNVHTTVFGMGEIRGNLGNPVPEPSSQMLLLAGLAFFFLRLWGFSRPQR